MTGINNIGVLNNPYGVCGFVSAFYALYESLPAAQREDLAAPASRKRWMAHMIYRFLEDRDRHDPLLLFDIQRFTKTFPGYEDFTIRGYMSRLKLAFEQGQETDLSSAMTPYAVVNLLIDMGFGGARLEIDTRNIAQRRLVGLCEDPVEGRPYLYNNLQHWIYFSNNTIYTYGEQYAGADFYDALQAFNADKGEAYSVGWLVRC